MRKIVGLFIAFISILSIDVVYAHPGRTDKSGCHKCHTNCASWGLADGEKHCHNGNTYSNSKGQVYRSDGTLIKNNKQVVKSSDNTLKNVYVDDESIEISDIMFYETKEENVKMKVETNSSKAKYSIKNKKLKIGENIISIQVIAENGRKKDYTLNITRRELSNNTNINVSVNNKKIIFEQNEAYIKLENIEKIDYKYELEDQNASVIVEGKPELEYGDNIIKFLVTSESGSTNEYKLVINRCNDEDKESKKESKNNTLINIGVLGIIGYGVYTSIKKKIA